LPSQDQRHLDVGRRHAPDHDELVVLRSLAEHVPDVHGAFRCYAAAGIPAKTSRTQAWVSHMAFRYRSRTDVMGPLPLTVVQNSSQSTHSGAPHSHLPLSSAYRRAGSGTVIPTSHSFGTYVEKNSSRRSSFERV